MTDAVNGSPQPTEPLNLPPIDPGNPMVTQAVVPQPALLTAAQQIGPQGPVLFVTVRTADATLTVKLARADAAAWGQFLHQAAAGMSALIVPPGSLS